MTDLRSPPRRRTAPRLLWAIAGLVLLVLGTAALVHQPQAHRIRVVGGNLPVDAGATNPVDLTASNSPTLVANPTDQADLVVVDRIDTPQPGCGLQASHDGGVTWTSTVLPGVAGKQVGCFSPDATFGPDGHLYVSFTSIDRVAGLGVLPDAAWITTSIDGGRSLGAPVRITGPGAFETRLAADPVTPRHLFLTWLQATQTSTWGLVDAGNRIVVSRSDDGGATWSQPVPVSSSARALVAAPSIAVDHHGHPHIAFLDLGDDRLDYTGAHQGMGGPPYPKPWTLVVSSNGDGSPGWSESVVDAGVVPTERILMSDPPRPSLKLGPGDVMYVAFTDGRSGDPDVRLWASHDLGRRWSPPRRVNDTPLRDGTDQYLPALGVAPDGRLDVMYYDRRSDPRDVRNDVSLQSSFDGGRTFTPHVRLSDRSFDASIGLNANRGLPQIGDRLGIISTNRATLAVWTDTRAGDRLSGKQNLSRAIVAFAGPSPSRVLWRVGAVVLLVAGAAALVWSARQVGKRRRGPDV